MLAGKCFAQGFVHAHRFIDGTRRRNAAPIGQDMRGNEIEFGNQFFGGKAAIVIELQQFGGDFPGRYRHRAVDFALDAFDHFGEFIGGQSRAA